MVRDEGADKTADALHSARAATGVLDADELPIPDYDELNLNDAVAAVKELEDPADIRTIIAYEEAHKDRAATGLRRADPRRRDRAGGRRPQLIPHVTEHPAITDRGVFRIPVQGCGGLKPGLDSAVATALPIGPNSSTMVATPVATPAWL